MSKLRASTFCLRLFHPRMDDRLVLLEAELGQHAVELVGAEDAHQIVFERQEELGAARIALTAGAAAELVVDAAAFVALGAQHEQSAGLQRGFLQPRHLLADRSRTRVPVALAPIGDVGKLVANAHVRVAAELDVGSAAGHVGGDGDCARHAGLRDDERLLLVVARVENGEDLGLLRALVAAVERGKRVGIGKVMLLPPGLAQHLGKALGFLDRRGSDQHGLAAKLAVLQQRDDGAVFLRIGPIDLIVLIVADHRTIGRHLDHVEIVDVHELFSLGQSRAGHAPELFVHAEVVLERDGGERLVFRLDRLMLFRFERLMQTFRIAAARHHAAGELVDDDNLAIADDVVLVGGEQLVGAQRLVDVMNGRNVLDVIERLALEQIRLGQKALQLLHACFGERDRALLLVDVVVGLFELRNVGVDGVVEIGTIVERAGNDERRTRLVDQDGVDLVDDGVGVPALDHVFQAILHVVAQIIEAEFIVGAVGDVAVVSLLALLIVDAVDDHAGGQAEEAVDLAHPLGVALGQVVVHRDHMNASPRERVEIDSQRCDQRLAFAGLHFGDLAFVQDHAADELHVEVPLTDGALGALAHGGKRRHQDIVERLAFGQFLLEGSGARAQFVVAELEHLGLERVDGVHPRLILADPPVVGGAEELTGDSTDHCGSNPCLGQAAGAAIRTGNAVLLG